MNIKKESITKRILIIIIMIILFITMLLVKIPSFAETSQPTNSNVLYLKLSEFMTQDTPHMGYAIGGDPGTNGNEGNAHHIWNIVQTTEQESKAMALLQQRVNSNINLLNILRTNSIATASTTGSQNIYCVNAETGFNDINSIQKYDVSYNMLTDKDSIRSQNNILQALVDDTIPVDESNKGKTISKYNALLALLDMLYLNDGKGEDTAETEKKEFLEKAGIKWSETFGYYYCSDGESNTYNCQKLLTNDDIKAVQQAAIWYFTNYYKNDTTTTAQPSSGSKNHYEKYDKTSSTPLLYYKLENGDSSDYKSLSDYRESGQDGEGREHEAEVLYKYLIKTAKEKANEYSNVGTSTKSEEDNAPVKFTTSELKYKVKGDKYIIGPINITKNTTNNVSYTLTMTVKNGENPVSEYEVLNESEKTVEDKDITKLVGNNFYISIPKSYANKEITVGFEIKYDSKKLTLWTSQNNAESTQPVVIPENEEHTVKEELSVTPKEFDLALRKYITKVDNKTLTGTDEAREPSINTDKLDKGTETTATYNHRKDPVEVKNGSRVTYKITIYNEGEKAGRATKVIDQLPSGLKFLSVKSENFEKEKYNENEDNKLILKRKENQDEDLSAYKRKGNLNSETIEIECEVTATAGDEDKILTNVAWISEAYDSESQVTITTNQGEDRDSEPGTEPKVNSNQTLQKDNLENYKGKEENKNVTPSDKEYYWKGQQDDDDFEKVVIKKAKGEYGLKIIKVDADKETQKLSGAKFNITINTQKQEEKTTNINGEISISSIDITKVGTDTITIEETKAPEGYKKLIETLTLQVTTTNDNGVYKAKKVAIQNQTAEGAKVKINNGVIEITVPNKKITGNYGLKIIKVDNLTDSTNRLKGAEFKVTPMTLNDGKWEEFKVTLPEGTSGTTEQTITTDDQGKCTIQNIKINSIEDTDTITIEETKAPEGYKKLIGKLTLEVTKENQNGEYKATEVTIQDQDTAGAKAEVKDNVIEVTVPNKKITGNYGLKIVKVDSTNPEQKLSGAVFTVNNIYKTATDTNGETII